MDSVLHFIKQLSFLWTGLTFGFLAGCYCTYKVMKAEIYEYVKASRRDQEIINQLNKDLSNG